MSEIKTFDVMGGNLPNLHEAQEVPVEFTSEYWTPEQNGETKLGFFQKIETSTYTDDETGESVELPCIILIEQQKDGSLKTIRNGSKRLVAAIEDALKKERVLPGMPLKITYKGKSKNKNNAFHSDTWSVKPLKIQNNG